LGPVGGAWGGGRFLISEVPLYASSLVDGTCLVGGPVLERVRNILKVQGQNLAFMSGTHISTPHVAPLPLESGRTVLGAERFLKVEVTL
jgi:hypothetical protein